jgi:hypothetical protein
MLGSKLGWFGLILEFRTLIGLLNTSLWVDLVMKYQLICSLGFGTAMVVMFANVARTAPQARVGWEFEGQLESSNVVINVTKYTGDCPGVKSSTLKARFSSQAVLPAPNHRVVVRNISPGVAQPRPYTDREYSQGSNSEPTLMEFGAEHSDKKLRVLNGKNTFEYEIQNEGRVVKTGKFTSNIQENLTSLVRNGKWFEGEVCSNSAIGVNYCADVRRQKEYKCPGGKVLTAVLEALPGGQKGSRSGIFNRTGQLVNIVIDGDRYRFRADESQYFWHSDAVVVRYGDRKKMVQPGQRLQLRLKPSGSIELVDYPRSDKD